MADSESWMPQGYSPSYKRSHSEVPKNTNGFKTCIHVTMINFLQLLMCVQECSSAATPAVQVLLCESFGLWGDGLPVCA